MSVEQRVAGHLEHGDADAAAREVIGSMGPSIARYLRAVLGDDDDAADAFSLFSEWTWKSIGSLRQQSSSRSWALGVAWRAARRVRDDPYRRRRVRLDTGAASDVAQPSSSSTRRHSVQLDELRAQLEPEEQNLLVLRIDQRLGWEEIAAVLASGGDSVTAATARKRFERLKERIASLARRRGLLRR